MGEVSETCGIVLVTVANQAEAESIAHTLIQAKLAACVSLLPIRSIYTWQGEVHHDQEWQMIIKTHLSQFAALETKVREIHSYDVPEIIALPITAGSAPYLCWLTQQLKDAP
jgi:periplasmic divalent cation tolerance protein